MLEGTKQAVLDMKAVLDEAGVVEQQTALRAAAGHTSKFTLRDLRARASRQRLEADFRAWLDGFSPNVQDILESFEFRNQIPRLSKADALGTLIEKLTSPDINLSPAPLKNHDGSVRHPGCRIPGRSPMSSRASSDVREASAGLPKLDPLAAEEVKMATRIGTVAQRRAGKRRKALRCRMSSKRSGLSRRQMS